MTPFVCYFITKYYSGISFVSHYGFARTQDKWQRETTVKFTHCKTHTTQDRDDTVIANNKELSVIVF